MPKITVNINNAPAGTTVEQRQISDREYIVDVMIEDAATGGRYSQAGQGFFGWQRRGR